jgi:glycerol-3-phosphate acyltransferase PlsX
LASVRIALDVMGGDHAPQSTLDGAKQALETWPDLVLLLSGDEAQLKALLPKHGLDGLLGSRIELLHAPTVVTMEDKGTAVLKEKKDSSMRVAAQAVREGRAHGVVSMGHTGAAMVASSMVIGRLEGVDRPGLASVMPNKAGRPTVLIDVGSNVDCRAEHIAQFAVMGAVYAEQVLGVANPKVGVLSVGEEESKGTEVTREAAALLRGLPLNFAGNAEGRDIWNGNFDVIACDGFVGNVVLKSSEALAGAIVAGIKEALTSSLTAKLGALMVKPGLKAFFRKLDYREYGGLPLLGIKGVSVIGHGSSDAKAVKNGIGAALRTYEGQVSERISAGIAGLLPKD